MKKTENYDEIGYGGQIIGYLSNNSFMIPLFATMLLSYAYYISHIAISVDTLSGNHYNFSGMVAQNRFANVILAKLLTTFGEKSLMFMNVLAILFLGLAAILFCVLLDQVTPRHGIVSRIIFACIFVSSPIYVEAFPYDLGPSIGVGMSLIAISLYLIITYKKGSKEIIKIIGLPIIFMFISAWYEALCVAYVIGAVAIIIIKIIFTEETHKTKEIINIGIYFLLTIIIGLILRQFMLYILRTKLQIGSGIHNYAKNTIHLFDPTHHDLRKFLHAVRYHYLYSGIWFAPIAIFVFSKCLCMLLMLFFTIKKRNLWFIPLFLMLHLVNMVLVILCWDENYRNMPIYRTCQSFGLYTAFLLFILIEYTSKNKSKLFINRLLVILSVYLVVIQTVQCDYWLSLNIRRFDEESQVLRNAAQILSREYDISKPVAFIGKYHLSNDFLDKVYLTKGTPEYKRAEKISQLIGRPIFSNIYQDGRHFTPRSYTMSSSVINWSLKAFNEPNNLLISYFCYLGFQIKGPTSEILSKANTLADSMPSFPAQGSIIDMGDFIVLKF